MMHFTPEVTPQRVKHGPMTGEVLRNRTELLPIPLRSLSTSERLRRGRVVQPIGVMHAPHECNLVHHLRHLRQMFTDLQAGHRRRDR
ncbi:MAG: hypothetical protein R3B91_05430 [Planctomycetaceae bacterium]